MSETPWSVRAAESFMQRKPVLMERWAYDAGIVLKGFEAIYNATADSKYSDYIETNISPFIEGGGKIKTYAREDFSMDNINCGKLMFQLLRKTGSEKYRKAADSLMAQLQDQPRSANGVFWHKQILPNQMLLDSLFMCEPFYAQYSKEFGQAGNFDDIAKQFILCHETLRDENTGLLYHACDLSGKMFWGRPESGLSSCLWGRAMGWFVMGLADTLEFFPEGHKDKPKLMELFDSTMNALVKVQSESGVWYQILDQAGKKGNYLEASASNIITYAMAKGVSAGCLDREKYTPALKKAYQGLIDEFITVTRQNLVNVNKICAMASLGGDITHDSSFEYYISEPIVTNELKGFGTFLLASAECEKLFA
jgi:unsaturated rhamnogalacturonyl hydrolase